MVWLFVGLGVLVVGITIYYLFPLFFIFTYFSKPVINFSKYLYKICFKFDITV